MRPAGKAKAVAGDRHSKDALHRGSPPPSRRLFGVPQACLSFPLRGPARALPQPHRRPSRPPQKARLGPATAEILIASELWWLTSMTSGHATPFLDTLLHECVALAPQPPSTGVAFRPHFPPCISSRRPPRDTPKTLPFSFPITALHPLASFGATDSTSLARLVLRGDTYMPAHDAA